MWEQIYLEMTDSSFIGVFANSPFATSIGYLIATTLTVGVILIPFAIVLKVLFMIIGGLEK